MAYIFNEHGVMQSIPNNSPLPTGARWANADEVAAYVEADTIRAAAGIPAPKSPQQAQLEHTALLENIANRGGLATPQERVNLDTTAQQAGAVPANAVADSAANGVGQRAGQAVVNRESSPVAESADLRPVGSPVGANAGPSVGRSSRVMGRGETAGNQYAQYEATGLGKVVTEETPDGVRRTSRPETVPANAPETARAAPESARRESGDADTREGRSTPAPAKADDATEGFSTPSAPSGHPAKNSPTAKDKEK